MMANPSAKVLEDRRYTGYSVCENVLEGFEFDDKESNSLSPSKKLQTTSPTFEFIHPKLPTETASTNEKRLFNAVKEDNLVEVQKIVSISKKMENQIILLEVMTDEGKVVEGLWTVVCLAVFKKNIEIVKLLFNYYSFTKEFTLRVLRTEAGIFLDDIVCSCFVIEKEAAFSSSQY
ncbi:uncharacterized protein [Oscarella lobularis]|uniref:uncharacterized protein isoform X2 n=1 Tax=Oscarella lobularis TaxID=121494 RepID=UPI00331447AF